jgi:hypothetical protein
MTNEQVIHELRDTATWIYAGFASQKVIDLLNRAADALEDADSDARAEAWDEGYAQGDRAMRRDPVVYKVNPYLNRVRLRDGADRA